MVKLGKASSETLRSGFKKCGLVPFDPSQVYKKLPSDNENQLTPRKALDSSLLKTLAQMRGNDDQDNHTTTKRVRLDVDPGKSICIGNSSGSDTESSRYEADTDESDLGSDCQSLLSTDSIEMDSDHEIKSTKSS